MRRLTNFRLPKPLNDSVNTNLWWLALDDHDRVLSVQPMANGSAISGENWNGDWLSPMGIDLQINGGLGLAFPELTTQKIPLLLKLLDQLWQDGVQAICPTLVSCAVAPLRQSLAVLQAAREHHCPQRCELLGAHLEGPFLSKARRGAHPMEHLCAPSLTALKERISGFESEISLMTLAPELPGASEVIEQLRALGIVVCLGHSAADAEDSALAFNMGVGMLTHCFNAMPGLHHRAPGPVGQACLHGQIALGLIADGIHVDPTMAVLLQQLAPEQLVLVSDCLAPYGLQEGHHHWDKRVLLVKEGTCRLKDGTLAGVTLPLLQGSQRLTRWSNEPAAAIWASTMAPRRVLGEKQNLQELLVNQPLTDLLRWQWRADTKDLIWKHAA
ncbi:MAG: N-acetylglucosamine-6-phosphate deacetylase [Prochlorococcus sp.]